MIGARYLLVDVFTDRSLAGNALAVFPDGGEVPEELRQPVARELNLSETAFVTAVGGGGYDVRIFTPASELPFAGHPTLGTAWTLHRLGLLAGDRAVQCSLAGETPVEFRPPGAWLHREGAAGPDLDDDRAITAAIGVPQAEVGLEAPWGRRLRPACADAGIEQLMVPIASPEALRRLAPGPGLAELALDGVYCFTVLGPGKVRTRFFAPGIGVSEDPGTGSAAAALGLYLADRAGALAFEIAQGEEVGRPSRILVEAEPGRVRVGGSVVPVGEGRLTIA